MAIIITSIFLYVTFFSRGNVVTYRYRADITLQEPGDYIVCIPLPIYKSDDVQYPIEDAADIHIISGHGELRIITTEYGPALQIKSNVTVSVYFEKTKPFGMGYNGALSLENGSNSKYNGEWRGKGPTYYWLYLNSTTEPAINISLEYSYDTSAKVTGGSVVASGVLSHNGWAMIEGKMERWFV